QVEVAEVGAAVAAGTGRAPAGRVEGGEILLVAGLLDDDAASRQEGLSVPRVPGRQDAVEHVDTGPDGDDKIAGRADTHEVARTARIERRRDLAEHLVHARDGLADAEAAKGKTIERQRAELLGVGSAQARVDAALDNAEQRLPWILRREAALRPAGRDA